jgi:translation elongation factor EF-G
MKPPKPYTAEKIEKLSFDDQVFEANGGEFKFVFNTENHSVKELLTSLNKLLGNFGNDFYFNNLCVYSPDNNELYFGLERRTKKDEHVYEAELEQYNKEYKEYRKDFLQKKIDFREERTKQFLESSRRWELEIEELKKELEELSE